MAATSTSPYPPFVDLLQAVREQSASINQYLESGGEQRPWMIPPQRGWSGDPLDIAGMTKPFDRQEPNSEYAEELNADNGATGVCQGKKVQIDYMAMMERAFRTRNMTVVRGGAHAAGRRKAHGNAGGVHVGGVQQYVQDLLRSGAESSS